MARLFTETTVKAKKVIEEREAFRMDKNEWYECESDQYIKIDDFTGQKIVMQEVCKEILITQIQFYCPLCKAHHDESDFLATAIENEKTRWLANMVTHYRHVHMNIWDEKWGAGGYGHQSSSQITYSIEKGNINNKSMQEIIKKATAFLTDHNITEYHFKTLQGSNRKTLDLASHLLNTSNEQSRKTNPQDIRKKA
ncbi:MAG: hypothetical protein WD267_09620 [Balneolales bacterium]